jgi:hypothetical protein
MTQAAWAPPEFFPEQAASFPGEEVLSSFTRGGKARNFVYKLIFKPFKNFY